jgi:hypothetical protein
MLECCMGQTSTCPPDPTARNAPLPDVTPLNCGIHALDAAVNVRGNVACQPGSWSRQVDCIALAVQPCEAAGRCPVRSPQQQRLACKHAGNLVKLNISGSQSVSQPVGQSANQSAERSASRSASRSACRHGHAPMLVANDVHEEARYYAINCTG